MMLALSCSASGERRDDGLRRDRRRGRRQHGPRVVGERVAGWGRTAVVCIPHRPAVASAADVHFRLEKGLAGDSAWQGRAARGDGVVGRFADARGREEIGRGGTRSPRAMKAADPAIAVVLRSLACGARHATGVLALLVRRASGLWRGPPRFWLDGQVVHHQSPSLPPLLGVANGTRPEAHDRSRRRQGAAGVRTKHLVKRLRQGGHRVVDHVNLDRIAAEGKLIEAGWPPSSCLAFRMGATRTAGSADAARPDPLVDATTAGFSSCSTTARRTGSPAARC